MLRYEISDQILGNQNQNLIISPEILIEIKKLLRYFDFSKEADIIHFLIKRFELWYIDNIIFKILELTKSYDGGKEWERTQNELKSYAKELERDKDLYYEDFKRKWKRKFIEILAYVLAYRIYNIRSEPVENYYYNEELEKMNKI
ncbi:MAG: hypothetical protein ACTSQP_19815 [Promethearchaeota archaeon]